MRQTRHASSRRTNPLPVRSVPLKMAAEGPAMNITDYLDEVRAKFASGQATEHSYRPALQSLFGSIDPALTVINEPKRSDTGMPDFLFQRGDVPVGWAEAEDLDRDVIKLKGYSVEQRRRYEKAYPNLIYTNGVDSKFYLMWSGFGPSLWTDAFA